VSRDQSRVFDSAGFGNEERADVENIDTMKLTETLETLETRYQSLARYQRGRDQLLSLPKRTQKMCAVRPRACARRVRARKGALAVVLLKACISVYFEDLCYLVKVEIVEIEAGTLTATNSVLSCPLPAIIIPVLYYVYEPQTYTPSVWFPHQILLDDHPLMMWTREQATRCS